MFLKKMKISNIELSDIGKSIIIAEIGINHEGRYQKCLDLISEAKNSGADLIKLQIADPKTDYSIKTKSFNVFNSATFSNEEIFNIYNFCRVKKIKIFSTFGRKNLEFFKKLNQCCYKISSSLFNDFYFINDILKLKKPVLISSGVSELKDIDLILRLIEQKNFSKVALMHCRSLYPTSFSKLNLSRIPYLRSKYGIITGFSDHSKGIEAPIAAIHYGSKIIEKHFTFDNKRRGFDHQISLTPKNFKEMVKKIRINEKMIGMHDYKINDNKSDFNKIKKISRRFMLLKNIKKNVKLTKNDFSLMRTNHLRNFSKFHEIFPKILKNKIRKNLKAGTVLKLSDFKKR